MKQLSAAFIAALFASIAYGTTWIGVVSDAHCGPDRRELAGDPAGCLVFISADREVYNFDNPQAVQPHVGREVSITGRLDDELTVGVTYEARAFCTSIP